MMNFLLTPLGVEYKIKSEFFFNSLFQKKFIIIINSAVNRSCLKEMAETVFTWFNFNSL